MTGKGTRPAPSPATLTDEAVAAYLRRNPDFFRDCPELLASLVPDAVHRADGTIDFQRFLVDKMRADMEGLRAQQGDLLGTSRANLAAQRRIHKAVLALLAAGDFAHLIEIVTIDLALLLDADVAALCVERQADQPRPADCGGVHIMDSGAVDAVLGSGSDVVLCADGAGDVGVFGAAAGLVRSAALIRLKIGSAAPPALLALGARQPGKFRTGQGTELLAFLARILERCIGTWLDLPEPGTIPPIRP
ncbi:MAG: DUF484 family protein [Alphaproteobacteria bacterium]